MLARLHFMGTPISPNATNQRDLTEYQRAFLNLALVEYVDEERDFQIQLHGGKSTRRPRGGVRDRAKSKLKDPRKIKRKKL